MTHFYIRKNTLLVLTLLSLLFSTIAYYSYAEEKSSTLSGRVVTIKGDPLGVTPIVLFHVKIRDEGGIETIYDKTLYPFLRQRPSLPANLPAQVRERMMGKMPNEQEMQTKPPYLKTVTDSEGRFTFSDVTSGLVQIMVLHANPPKKKPAPPGREHLNYTIPPMINSIKFGKYTFYPHEFSYSPESGGVTFAIKPGSKIENVEVLMGSDVRNQLMVQGKILFKDGTPLTNASLKANIGQMDIYDTEGDAFSRKIQTDANGNFLLSVYAPGIYTLSIEHRGLSSLSDMFIVNEDEQQQDLVMTLDGNSNDFVDPPQENGEPQNDPYRFAPDIPKVWIVNPENGHAYRAVRCENREEAQTIADAEDAHLVTITSESEQIWLEVAFGNAPYWIGLSYIAFGSKWQWDTGEQIAYTNWPLEDLTDPSASSRYTGESVNSAIMSKDGRWKAVDSDDGFRERVQIAVIEKDGMRAMKTDPVE